MKSHYPGCMSDEECKCQDYDNEAESVDPSVSCNLCADSGTQIIGEQDGKNFWNRCAPCECRANPIIPVKANDWAYLNKCASVVEWMGSHGVCWRGATNVNSSWRIGDETEWLYGDGHKVIMEAEEHMAFFRHNVIGQSPTAEGEDLNTKQTLK